MRESWLDVYSKPNWSILFHKKPPQFLPLNLVLGSPWLKFREWRWKIECTNGERWINVTSIKILQYHFIFKLYWGQMLLRFVSFQLIMLEQAPVAQNGFYFHFLNSSNGYRRNLDWMFIQSQIGEFCFTKNRPNFYLWIQLLSRHGSNSENEGEK